MREFDVEKKRFVSESEGGFRLPEAKSDLCYRGRDVLLVGTDTGEGSMTDSGYVTDRHSNLRPTDLQIR